jgi:hypothetical protein
MPTIYRTTHADGHSTSGQNRSTAVANARREGAVRVEKWNIELNGSRCVESLVKVVWPAPRSRGGFSDLWRNRQAEVAS